MRRGISSCHAAPSARASRGRPASGRRLSGSGPVGNPGGSGARHGRRARLRAGARGSVRRFAAPAAGLDRPRRDAQRRRLSLSPWPAELRPRPGRAGGGANAPPGGGLLGRRGSGAFGRPGADASRTPEQPGGPGARRHASPACPRAGLGPAASGPARRGKRRIHRRPLAPETVGRPRRARSGPGRPPVSRCPDLLGRGREIARRPPRPPHPRMECP